MGWPVILLSVGGYTPRFYKENFKEFHEIETGIGYAVEVCRSVRIKAKKAPSNKIVQGKT